MIYVGVDFGGTKIEAAALDGEGNFLSRLRAPNPRSYADAIETVADLVSKAVQTARPSVANPAYSVGIGVPGSIAPVTGLMRNANTVWLNGQPFRADIESRLGGPVRMANDANCLALSEAIDGAGAQSATVFAIILGTGCGGGVVVDRKLIDGATGVAGEWGHLPLPWATEAEYPGPNCWCGRRGCLETWISGSGLARDFQSTTGRALTGEEIISAWRTGDADAGAAFERFLSRLGRAMANIVNIFDPDMFVIGGGLSNIGEIYDRIGDYIRPHVFGEQWNGQVRPAVYGDSSGVRGAAYLWKDETTPMAHLIKT